jgi:hypothetical protein
MSKLTEGKLACDFPPTWHVTKYDDWAFYRKQFLKCCTGNKGMDFLGFNPTDQTLWMIELKDYRRFRRTKDEKIPLWDEVAIKARDTLSGLFAAKVEAGHTDHEFAKRSMTAMKLRVVLHLEQPTTHTKLFPRAYDPADIQQEIKRLVKPIDAHPCVVDLGNMNRVPWTAESIR